MEENSAAKDGGKEYGMDKNNMRHMGEISMEGSALSKLNEDTQDFEASQERTLLKILQDNQNTVYGRRYGFAGIRSAKEYRKKVPVTVYSDYEELIRRMLAGEKQVTSAYPLRYCVVSSGTTGKNKYIPVADTGISLYERYVFQCAGDVICEYYQKNGRKLSKEELTARVFRLNEVRCGRLENGCKTLMMSNAVYQRRLEEGTFDFHTFTSPEQVLFPRYEMDMNYLKLRYALADKQVTGIEGVYVHQVLNILHYLEQNWERLTQDIADGIIHKDIQVPQEVRSQLEPGLVPMPERAAKLREEFERGFDTPVVPRIWKNIRYVMAVSGDVFDAYMKKLRRYIGTTPYHYLLYGASEGIFAAAAGIDYPGQYIFAPELGYCEFLPEGTENPRDVCGVQNLEIGKRYELIHTGYAGLYRHRMGDVLEVTGFYNSAPMVKFCYRRAQEVNLAGEKMDQETLSHAVRDFAAAYGMEIENFCVYPDTDKIPAEYVLLLESPQAGHADMPGLEAAETIDRLLRKHNIDYDDCRRLKEIGPSSVYFLKNGTTKLHMEYLRKRGMDVSQYKPVRVIDTPEKKEFFFGNILDGRS